MRRLALCSTVIVALLLAGCASPIAPATTHEPATTETPASPEWTVSPVSAAPPSPAPSPVPVVSPTQPAPPSPARSATPPPPTAPASSPGTFELTSLDMPSDGSTVPHNSTLTATALYTNTHNTTKAVAGTLYINGQSVEGTVISIPANSARYLVLTTNAPTGAFELTYTDDLGNTTTRHLTGEPKAVLSERDSIVWDECKREGDITVNLTNTADVTADAISIRVRAANYTDGVSMSAGFPVFDLEAHATRSVTLHLQAPDAPCVKDRTFMTQLDIAGRNFDPISVVGGGITITPGEWQYS